MVDVQAAIGKRVYPVLHQLEVALTPVPRLAKRRMFEDAVLGEEVCSVGEAPLVEAIVVLADEKVCCCHGPDNYKAYHAPHLP
jgi:hypothetical protein